MYSAVIIYQSSNKNTLTTTVHLNVINHKIPNECAARLYLYLHARRLKYLFPKWCGTSCSTLMTTYLIENNDTWSTMISFKVQHMTYHLKGRNVLSKYCLFIQFVELTWQLYMPATCDIIQFCKRIGESVLSYKD